MTTTIYTARHIVTMNPSNPDGTAVAVLGEHERITAYEALWAATIGAAEQLHLDDVIGSIECGKWADFAVLDESPLDVDPMSIKDIGVRGTVVGGVVYPAPSTS